MQTRGDANRRDGAVGRGTPTSGRHSPPQAGGSEGPRVRGWFASRPGPGRSASSGRLRGTRLSLRSAQRCRPPRGETPMIGSARSPRRHEKVVRHSRWQGPTSSAQVSRSRACRPEVYTFPGITFSWGRHLANEWRRPGCVGARPVAGRRRPEEEGGEGSELAEPHMAWWRPSQGPSPFFLLPAMKLLPAHPRRRRHPEGRSAAEEARSALPSPPRMGTMLSSCRKQENHVSFFPGPSGVRGTEGPYLTNLSADPPGATNQRYVFRTPTPDCASTDLGRDGTHGRRAAPSSSQYRPSRTSRRLTSPRGTSLGRTTAP